MPTPAPTQSSKRFAPFPGCPLACHQPPSLRRVSPAYSHCNPSRNAKTQSANHPTANHPTLALQKHNKRPAALLNLMPLYNATKPSLNSKPGCIKVVDTFRHAPLRHVLRRPRHVLLRGPLPATRPGQPATAGKVDGLRAATGRAGKCPGGCFLGKRAWAGCPPVAVETGSGMFGQRGAADNFLVDLTP